MSICERPTEIKHVRIESAELFAETELVLDESVPTLDMRIVAALAKGNRTDPVSTTCRRLGKIEGTPRGEQQTDRTTRLDWRLRRP